MFGVRRTTANRPGQGAHASKPELQDQHEPEHGHSYLALMKEESPMHRKPYQLLVVAALLVLCGLSLSGFKRDQTEAELPAQSKTVQIRQLLSEEGLKSGTTFTIEEAILKGGTMDRIRSFRRPTPPEGTGLTAVLDDLSQSIPNFTWYADPNNPNMIHVVDTQLLHWKGYALDRNIDEIHFTGTVSGLVDAIAAKGVPVSAVGTFDTQALGGWDSLNAARRF